MPAHASVPNTWEGEAGRLSSRPAWTTQGDFVWKQHKVKTDNMVSHLDTVFPPAKQGSHSSRGGRPEEHGTLDLSGTYICPHGYINFKIPAIYDNWIVTDSRSWPPRQQYTFYPLHSAQHGARRQLYTPFTPVEHDKVHSSLTFSGHFQLTETTCKNSLIMSKELIHKWIQRKDIASASMQGSRAELGSQSAAYFFPQKWGHFAIRD